MLHGVSLSIESTQIVAIAGPNGAGKSTPMPALMGLPPRNRRVAFMGQDAGDVGWMVQRGVVLVPETRALFIDMSVEDTLQLGAFSRWRQSRGVPVTCARVQRAGPSASSKAPLSA